MRDHIVARIVGFGRDLYTRDDADPDREIIFQPGRHDKIRAGLKAGRANPMHMRGAGKILGQVQRQHPMIVDGEFVRNKLGAIIQSEDLSKFIL